MKTNKLSDMRNKLILLFSMVIFTADVFGSGGNIMHTYRWRNDDGSESAATWKAAENTGTTLSSANTNFRLRIAHTAVNFSPGSPGGYSLEYSTDQVDWTTITTDRTVNAFALSLTTYFNDGDATTNQLSTLDFTPWYCISSSEISPAPASTDAGNELEWCLQATTNAIAGTTYYFRTTNVNSAVTYDVIASLYFGITTWDGSESSDWITSGNWSSDVVPTSADDILIPNTVTNYPTLYSAGACNNITMQSGASLLGNAYLTVSGAATVDRAVPGTSQAWHFLSSPVETQAISPAFTPDPATSYDFFAWYEPTGEWVNFKNTTTAPTWTTANGNANFTTCKGYLVEYTGTGLTKQFTGNLNSGSKTLTISKAPSGAYAGYNLAGNPYPSAIDWKAESGWDRSLLVERGGGYVMSIGNDAVSAGNYGVFNSAGSSGSGTNGVTQYIPVGQGFMVKAASAGALGMTDAVRVHSGQGFLKSTEETANILRLKVAGNANTYSDEIIIEFGHQTADGGAEKMFSFYETAPSLYTVKPDGNYSIDFRGEPGPVTIPMSFKAGADGNYTLTASQLESYPSSAAITLEDVKLNTTQNLMHNPSYTFTSLKTDDAARFLLHFGGAFSVNDNEKEQPVRIYASGNTVYIASTSGVMLKGGVILYNMIGQQVMERQLNENPLTSITLNGAAGYYLVKVVTGDHVCSGKVFIN
jgi:hypothetical protein